MLKIEEKPADGRVTEAQVRTYFKEAYEIYDAERDTLHEMGVANNAVMQKMMNKLTAKNAQMKQESN